MENIEVLLEKVEDQNIKAILEILIKRTETKTLDVS